MWRWERREMMKGGFLTQAVWTKCSCLIITGDGADGAGVIHSLESVQKCLTASKSAEHVDCAKHMSKHSVNRGVIFVTNQIIIPGIRVSVSLLANGG